MSSIGSTPNPILSTLTPTGASSFVKNSPTLRHRERREGERRERDRESRVESREGHRERRETRETGKDESERERESQKVNRDGEATVKGYNSKGITVKVCNGKGITVRTLIARSPKLVVAVHCPNHRPLALTLPPSLLLPLLLPLLLLLLLLLLLRLLLCCLLPGVMPGVIREGAQVIGLVDMIGSPPSHISRFSHVPLYHIPVSCGKPSPVLIGL